MVTVMHSAPLERMAKSAKANGHSSTETSKANDRDARGPPLRKSAHSGARHRSPQPDQQITEENSPELQMTLRVDIKRRSFRVDSSACLNEHLQRICPPEFLNNVFDIIIEQEQDAGFVQGLIQEDDVLGSWQSFEKSKERHSRSVKQSSKTGPLPPGHASTSVRKRKSRTQIQLHSQLEAITIDSSEEDLSDDDEIGTESCQHVNIQIGDAQAVDDCYHGNFEAIQQIPCKYIAKAWVKVKEPKKQAHHPYNGGKLKDEAIAKYGKENQGALSMPGWWPREDCRHKEPDHIKKPERMILLKHMVKNIGIPCVVLEESTKELPRQAKEVTKKPFKHFLDEIYFVRKKQEAFERGEIDSTSTVPVRIHKKSEAGQPRKPPKKSAKSSTSAKNSAPYRTVSGPQLTPRTNTSRSCQGLMPLLPSSNCHVEEPRCEQVLEDDELFRQTQSIVAPIFPNDAPSYHAAGGPRTQPNFTHAYDAQLQGFPTQFAISIPAEPQATDSQSFSNRGLQSALSSHARSSAPSLPEASCRHPIQQLQAIKTERALQTSNIRSSVPSSLVSEASLDHQTLAPVLSERPRYFTASPWSYDSSEQRNGLPSIPSQHSSFSEYDDLSDLFRASSTGHTQVSQLIDYHGSLELDESSGFVGNFQYPSHQTHPPW